VTPIIPIDVPVWLEWRDAEDRLMRQRVSWSMVAMTRTGIETITAPLPEVGDLVVIDTWRPERGEYRLGQLWLYVTSRPRWTLKETQPHPEHMQTLREVAIYCTDASDEQEARRG
jgi:hypothetical protein